MLNVSTSALRKCTQVIVLCSTDGDITPAWLLAFKNWSAILVGCTGLLGCMVSLKYMTSCAHQSASPRISLGGISHLKRHQSDLCDIKTATLPDGWEADPMAPDMVSKCTLCSPAILFAELDSLNKVIHVYRHLSGAWLTSSIYFL